MNKDYFSRHIHINKVASPFNVIEKSLEKIKYKKGKHSILVKKLLHLLEEEKETNEHKI